MMWIDIEGVFVLYTHSIRPPQSSIGFWEYWALIVRFYEGKRLLRTLALILMIGLPGGLAQGLAFRKEGWDLVFHILFQILLACGGMTFLYLAWMFIHYWGLWKSETRIEGNSLCYGKNKKIEKHDIKEFIFLNDRILKVNNGKGGPSEGTILVYLENESDVPILKSWFGKQGSI